MNNFIIGFIYFVYFVFLGHQALTTKFDDFLFFFSKTGLYFALLTILWGSFLVLLTYIKNEKLKTLLTYKDKIGLTVIITLLLSHLIAISNPLQSWSLILGEKTGWHQNVYLFLLGLVVFLIGMITFKKSNKKTMIVGMMLLFIHGVYLAVLWNSLYQQKNVYEEFYIAAAKNNVMVTQCQQIACAKLNSNKDIKPLFDSIGSNSHQNLFIQSILVSYLTAFEKKIENSKQDTVSFSYGDGLKGFVGTDYTPIGVYNKKNHFLIIDYIKLKEVVKNHDEVYKRITGVAAIFWLFLLFIMIGWHHWLKEKRMKKETQEIKND